MTHLVIKIQSVKDDALFPELERCGTRRDYGRIVAGVRNREWLHRSGHFFQNAGRKGLVGANHGKVNACDGYRRKWGNQKIRRF